MRALRDFQLYANTGMGFKGIDDDVMRLPLRAACPRLTLSMVAQLGGAEPPATDD